MGAMKMLNFSQWLYLFAAIGGAGSMLATSFTQPNAIWQQFLAQSLLFGLTVAYGVQVGRILFIRQDCWLRSFIRSNASSKMY